MNRRRLCHCDSSRMMIYVEDSYQWRIDARKTQMLKVKRSMIRCCALDSPKFTRQKKFVDSLSISLQVNGAIKIESKLTAPYLGSLPAIFFHDIDLIEWEEVWASHLPMGAMTLARREVHSPFPAVDVHQRIYHILEHLLYNSTALLIIHRISTACWTLLSSSAV